MLPNAVHESALEETSSLAMDKLGRRDPLACCLKRRCAVIVHLHIDGIAFSDKKDKGQTGSVDVEKTIQTTVNSSNMSKSQKKNAARRAKKKGAEAAEK